MPSSRRETEFEPKAFLGDGSGSTKVLEALLRGGMENGRARQLARMCGAGQEVWPGKIDKVIKLLAKTRVSPTEVTEILTSSGLGGIARKLRLVGDMSRIPAAVQVLRRARDLLDSSLVLDIDGSYLHKTFVGADIVHYKDGRIYVEEITADMRNKDTERKGLLSAAALYLENKRAFREANLSLLMHPLQFYLQIILQQWQLQPTMDTFIPNYLNSLDLPVEMVVTKKGGVAVKSRTEPSKGIDSAKYQALIERVGEERAQNMLELWVESLRGKGQIISYDEQGAVHFTHLDMGIGSTFENPHYPAKTEVTSI